MSVGRANELGGVSGVIGGYAPLDSGLLVPVAYLPPGSVGRGCELVSANTTVGSGATVTLDVTSETDDDDGWHQTATTAITGTVTKTASSLTLTGSGTAFLTELAAGSVISVPGTATEILAVRSVESNTSLTLWNAPANTASGQTATRKREYFVVPSGQTGRYLYSLTVLLGLEATPTATSYAALFQMTNSVTESQVSFAMGTPNATSNSITFSMTRRKTFTQGEIYFLKGINNNDASVTVQAIFDISRLDSSAALGSHGHGDLTGAVAATAYTPVLTASVTNPTLGTGGATRGRYIQIGKVVYVWGSVTFGTSGVNPGSGEYNISVPVNINGNSTQVIGDAVIYDDGTQFRSAIPYTNLPTADRFRLANPTAAGLTVQHNNPQTFAANDSIIYELVYEAA